MPRPSSELRALDASLESLLRSYQEALQFVEQKLPSLGRWGPVRYFEPSRRDVTDIRWSLLYPKRRWVSKPLVRWFMEAHIYARSRVLRKYLEIETLPITEEEDPLVKNIESWSKKLGSLEKALFSWSNPGEVFSRSPFLPLLLAILIAAVRQFTSLDFSDTNSAVETFSAFIRNSTELKDFTLLDWAGWVAVRFSLAYVLIAPFMVNMGFRIKRLIFAGGEDTFTRIIVNDETEKWAAFPGTNIYEGEKKVFELLGVQKPGEFPLDLVMNMGTFYSALLAILLVGPLISNPRPEGDYFAFFACPGIAVLVALWFVGAGIYLYINRRIGGNL